MPIIDYHCHLNPKEIADDTRFEKCYRPGFTATITNGAGCAATELTNDIAPAKHPIMKNSQSGRKQFLILYAIPFITGLTSN